MCVCPCVLALPRVLFHSAALCTVPDLSGFIFFSSSYFSDLVCRYACFAFRRESVEWGFIVAKPGEDVASALSCPSYLRLFCSLLNLPSGRLCSVPLEKSSHEWQGTQLEETALEFCVNARCLAVHLKGTVKT